MTLYITSKQFYSVYLRTFLS